MVGTIFPCQDFDALNRAERLKNAMSGVGTDEKEIIRVLTTCDARQRAEIAERFKASYGEDLREKLHGELSGDFRRAVMLAFYDPAHVNAKACYKAIKGAGTDERVLIDTICTSDNDELADLKAAYNDILEEYKEDLTTRSLEADIQGDTSGDFEKVLVALIQANREDNFSREDAVPDATELFEAGQAKLGTCECVFTKVLCTRSFKSLVFVDAAYSDLAGNDIYTAIEKETSGYYCDSLCTIMKRCMAPILVHAMALHKTMKGAGTHEANLMRIIMAHAETDMKEIMVEYERYCGNSLIEDIKGDTSGDFQTFLCAMLGEPVE